MVNITELDQWLARSEKVVPKLRTGTAKKIIWDGKPGTKTDTSIIYIHGFSASLNEIRPVPDLIAAELKANIFYTRLDGHGQDGKAIAETTHKHWFRDTKEAIEIGHIIGKNVILMGCSTGCALIHIALGQGQSAKAAIYISPNFGLKQGWKTAIARLPGAKLWIPIVFGKEQSLNPLNAKRVAYWTMQYPTIAALNVKSVIAAARNTNHTAITVPTLMWFVDTDQKVSARWTRKIASMMGGNITLHNPVLTNKDDQSHHVILGDIISPSQTNAAMSTMLQWLSHI